MIEGKQQDAESSETFVDMKERGALMCSPLCNISPNILVYSI